LAKIAFLLKSFLLIRDLGEKQEVRAKLLGKHGWGISEIF
jgi:hypothetical protein